MFLTCFITLRYITLYLIGQILYWDAIHSEQLLAETTFWHWMCQDVQTPPIEQANVKKEIYLIQDGLPFFGVSNRRQLHVSHFLHLLIHVDLLLQLLDFCAQQAHSVLSMVLAGDSGGACRVDGCDPVFQLRLAAGLRRHRQQKVRG